MRILAFITAALAAGMVHGAAAQNYLAASTGPPYAAVSVADTAFAPAPDSKNTKSLNRTEGHRKAGPYLLPLSIEESLATRLDDKLQQELNRGERTMIK